MAYMKNSWPVTGMPVVNMWWAHDERQDGDGRGGVHHGGIAEQLLAAECGHDLADDAEGRQIMM